LFKKFKKHLHRPPPEPPAILLREWTAVVFLIVFILILLIVAEATRVRAISVAQGAPELFPAPQKQLQITLTGAVQNPGLYFCTPGTSLASLLKQAKLLKGADRKKINQKKILYSNQQIEIPFK
jgi:hypothetical protein